MLSCKCPHKVNISSRTNNMVQTVQAWVREYDSSHVYNVHFVKRDEYVDFKLRFTTVPLQTAKYSTESEISVITPCKSKSTILSIVAKYIDYYILCRYRLVNRKIIASSQRNRIFSVIVLNMKKHSDVTSRYRSADFTR